MKTYILKLKTTSTTNYNLYDGTTLVSDSDLATLFGSAGSAYFTFDFNEGTPTNTTSLTILNSQDTAVMTNTGLEGIAEDRNFKGVWADSATALTSFTLLKGVAMDEAELTTLVGMIKNASPDDYVLLHVKYDSTSSKFWATINGEPYTKAALDAAKSAEKGVMLTYDGTGYGYSDLQGSVFMNTWDDWNYQSGVHAYYKVSFYGFCASNGPLINGVFTFYDDGHVTVSSPTKIKVPSVVQSTGQNTNNVMSQKAVTDALNAQGIKTLTTADYNYPADNPILLLIGSLPAGIYKIAEGFPSGKAYWNERISAGALNINDILVVVGNANANTTHALLIKQGNNGAYTVVDYRADPLNDPGYLLSTRNTINTLTSTSTTAPLSAAQGKVLNDNKADKTAFTGTDGTSTGTMGLVPAPATTDAGKVLKADGTWTGLPDGIKTLTSADYDWPTANPDGVALWKLEAGAYKAGAGVKVHVSTLSSEIVQTDKVGLILVSDSMRSIGSLTDKTIMLVSGFKNFSIYATSSNGSGQSPTTTSGTTNEVLISGMMTDSLADDSSYKVGSSKAITSLNNKIEGRVIQNAGAPTTSTVGTVGMLLEDTTNGKLYQCTAVDNTDPQNPSYTWSEIGGGSGPTVVQTTGTSTTDVMSQKAVTDLITSDPQYVSTVRIGESAAASGSYSVAIGGSARVNTHNYAVAIGQGATTSAKGEFAIGTSNSHGYNNSDYRLLTGLYDPQSAHDAATKGYVDGTTETLTIADTDWSALSSSDPYTYSATVSVTATIGANSTVELINDNAVSFGTYGFAIGSVDQPNNQITVYSIGSPSASVNLKINVKGA